MRKIILVAGGTGNLGERIINVLLDRGAEVHAVVRSGSDTEKTNKLEKLGVKVFKVNMSSVEEVSKACIGVSCVVSALAGLRDVIIDIQRTLLDAAVAAGVPRFIPSDYSLDFTKFSPGENRNLDLRREFHGYLDKTSISATTIFNGAFAHLLTGDMPLILFKQKRVLYWGNADHRMGFTTIEDTATFTANAALDSTTPRYLHIAGDQISPREIKNVLIEMTGKKFHLFRPGGPGMLSTMIKIAHTIAPAEKELYPAWQGMQYMRNMIDDRSNLETIDNDRYPGIRWTTIKDLLSAHYASEYPNQQMRNQSL
ncbi:MAG: NmrA family NAD(P)-binding protein [Bacteroidales bacterium]|jgi:nucleoside-diphosphate-sugar epimerase